MTRLFNAAVLLGYILTLGLLPSCSGGGKPTTSSVDYDEVVRCYAADESLNPILDEELDSFYQKTRKGPLYPLYVSEAEALQKLLNMDVFLAFTTRRLTTEEENIIRGKNYTLRTFPLAYDGMALIVNNENPDTVMLVENFKKILTGEVTTWRELYSDSKLDTIRVVFDNPKSATVRFCVDSILQGAPMKTSGNIRAVETSKRVLEYVENHRNAIGIIGTNWVDDRHDETNTIFNHNVMVMRVGYNAVDAVKPYQYYIATGDYPFIRTIYAHCTDPRTSGLAMSFANFCWLPEPGQRIFFRAGFFPARAEYRLRDVVIK